MKSRSHGQVSKWYGIESTNGRKNSEEILSNSISISFYNFLILRDARSCLGIDLSTSLHKCLTWLMMGERDNTIHYYSPHTSSGKFEPDDNIILLDLPIFC